MKSKSIAKTARAAPRRKAPPKALEVPPPEAPSSGWTFFSNHAYVLFTVAADPQARLRDIAERVEITERAVQRILAELEAEGYVTITKEGRRNRYKVNPRRPLRRSIERHRTVKSLLELVLGDGR